MDYLNRIGISSRAGTFRRNVIGFLVLLAGVPCVFCAFVHAAPVTLRLEATVGPPRQGFDATVPPSWNISLQEGDAISGMFTFEPFDAAPNSDSTTLVQPFDFAIRIKSRTLITSQYGLEVFNNVMADDVPEPYDSIHLGCSLLGGGTVCAPTNESPLDPIEWAFGIALFGDEALLDGADIPSDPLTWQELVSGNTMLVSFRHPVAGWSYGFLATIDSFRQVPEPSTSFPFALGIAFILVTRRDFSLYRD